MDTKNLNYTEKGRAPEGSKEGLFQPAPEAGLEKKAGAVEIVSHGDRITFTLVSRQEVVSVHFDRKRGEIFYKGHNIRNMEIDEHHLHVLEKFRQVLPSDIKGKKFSVTYAQTLDKFLMERKLVRP